MTGNGLFLLGMAKKRKGCNFLGLEINEKVSESPFEYFDVSCLLKFYFINFNTSLTFQLVKRCLDSVQLSGIKNGYRLLLLALH